MKGYPVSVILATGARYILPLMLLFAFFILLRGHNEPGGGFIGGLVVACGFSLFALAYSVDEARQILRVQPIQLIGWGLLIALLSGLPALLLGMPFMTGLWPDFTVPAIGKVGTPTFFDIGVFMVVIGVILNVVFSLAES